MKRKRKFRKLLSVILFITMTFTNFTIKSGAGIVANADTVAEFVNAMVNATNDTTIILGSGFAADMAANGGAAAVVAHDYHLTIDGSGAGALTVASGLHLNITNNGQGTITLKDVSFQGANGGVKLGTAGKYTVDNCSFTGFTTSSNPALSGGKDILIRNSYFANNSNQPAYQAVKSAKVEIRFSTFENNTNRALVLATRTADSGGTAADKAEFLISKSYFNNNSKSGSSSVNVNGEGGGAVYCSGSHLILNVEDSVFIGNQVIGTGTGHGSNNRIDGGALYVSGDLGMEDIVFNAVRSNFENNFAQDDGGAIIVLGQQSGPTRIRSNIVNCTFNGNSAAGAHYGRDFGIVGNTWCTDGTGGAISYFGLTESSITHCTFWNNGLTNDLPAGVSGTNAGSVGGGGAIGVDTGQNISNIENLPPCPILTNNIFVGNYIKNPASQTMIDIINSYTSNSLGNIKERSKTGNVFILPACDADVQNAADDPRGLLDNNGNIGWDNGNWNTDGSAKMPANLYNDKGINPAEQILIKNVFADTNDQGDGDDANDTPNKSFYGESIGNGTVNARRWVFLPSPLSDELYRDGSGPYYDPDVRFDTRGYRRDVFPNAGAAEIYWTKYDPGYDGGDGIDPDTDGGNNETAVWSSGVPASIPNPDDPANPYRVIPSLGFAANQNYYIMTGIPNNLSAPSGYTKTMPRSALSHSNEMNYGFAGWRSSQPDEDLYLTSGADISTYPTLIDYLLSNPVSGLPSAAFPLYQPNSRVLSTKQTLKGEWEKDHFRVDFELNYDGDENTLTDTRWYLSGVSGKEAPRLHVIRNTAIVAPDSPQRASYVFDGWYYANGKTLIKWNFDTDIVIKDMTLFAKWIPTGEVVIQVQKTFAQGGDTPTDYPAFIFVLTQTDSFWQDLSGRAAYSDSVSTNGAATPDTAVKSFSSIVKEPGVYYYKITETDGGVTGWLYSTAEKHIRVTVANDGSISYSEDYDGSTVIPTFENRFTKSGGKEGGNGGGNGGSGGGNSGGGSGGGGKSPSGNPSPSQPGPGNPDTPGNNGKTEIEPPIVAEKPPVAGLPKTGDSLKIWLWGGLALFAGLGFFGF